MIELESRLLTLLQKQTEQTLNYQYGNSSHKNKNSVIIWAHSQNNQ